MLQKKIKYGLCFLLILMSSFLFSQIENQQIIKLYPGIAPGSETWNWNEQEYKTRQQTISYNVTVPTLTVFKPDSAKSTGQAVVICPGGGYGMVAFGHEGTRWAGYFNDLGIAAIVVKYRLPNGDYKIPVGDAETAMQIVKDSAQVWNINSNNVGIMGFSAGGHLASTIATHTQPPLKPLFQILFYPVITMDKSYTHIGSHDSFLGKDTDKTLEVKFSNEKQVNKDTPPAFVVLAADDQVVPPANGINYFQALISNHVYATLHVYPTGNHGWGYSNSYKFNKAILDEMTLWLSQIK